MFQPERYLHQLFCPSSFSKHQGMFKNLGCTKGTWVAQMVQRLTLDLGSGHDLTVMTWSSESGSTGSVSLLKILSLPLPCSLSLSLSLSK